VHQLQAEPAPAVPLGNADVLDDEQRRRIDAARLESALELGADLVALRGGSDRVVHGLFELVRVSNPVAVAEQIGLDFADVARGCARVADDRDRVLALGEIVVAAVSSSSSLSSLPSMQWALKENTSCGGAELEEEEEGAPDATGRLAGGGGISRTDPPLRVCVSVCVLDSR